MRKTDAPPPHVGTSASPVGSQRLLTNRISEPSGDQCGFVFDPDVVSGPVTVPVPTFTV
jgi:hypothetical protein